MTYKKIIERLDALYPNEYKEAEKLFWIDEVNADVISNIEKRADALSTAQTEDLAIVPKPYEDIYIYYILAQIAYHQRDSESYQRHIAMYSARREDYAEYWIRTYGGVCARFKNWI